MLKSQQKKLPRQGAVKVYRDGREVCDLETVKGGEIYRGRTREMALAQGNLCAICGFWMRSPQFDHAAGRGSGGAHRDDRAFDEKGRPINAAVHETCNLLKGSRRYKWVNGVYKPVEKYKEKAA